MSYRSITGHEVKKNDDDILIKLDDKWKHILQDPISYEYIKEPVVLQGHLFDKEPLIKWLRTSDTNPMTGEILPPSIRLYKFNMLTYLLYSIEEIDGDLYYHSLPTTYNFCQKIGGILPIRTCRRYNKPTVKIDIQDLNIQRYMTKREKNINYKTKKPIDTIKNRELCYSDISDIDNFENCEIINCIPMDHIMKNSKGCRIMFNIDYMTPCELLCSVDYKTTVWLNYDGNIVSTYSNGERDSQNKILNQKIERLIKSMTDVANKNVIIKPRGFGKISMSNYSGDPFTDEEIDIKSKVEHKHAKNLEQLKDSSVIEAIERLSNSIGDDAFNFEHEEKPVFTNMVNLNVFRQRALLELPGCMDQPYYGREYSYLNLQGKEFNNISFKGDMFVGTNLSNTRFINCNFNRVEFYKANLNDAVFEDCHFNVEYAYDYLRPKFKAIQGTPIFDNSYIQIQRKWKKIRGNYEIRILRQHRHNKN